MKKRSAFSGMEQPVMEMKPSLGLISTAGVLSVALRDRPWNMVIGRGECRQNDHAANGMGPLAFERSVDRFVDVE